MFTRNATNTFRSHFYQWFSFGIKHKIEYDRRIFREANQKWEKGWFPSRAKPSQNGNDCSVLFCSVPFRLILFAYFLIAFYLMNRSPFKWKSLEHLHHFWWMRTFLPFSFILSAFSFANYTHFTSFRWKKMFVAHDKNHSSMHIHTQIHNEIVVNTFRRVWG